MVTDLELNDLGCTRTFEMPRQFREKPIHGRAPTLQAKDHGAIFLARRMILSYGWLNDDGKLIQHQKTPRQTLLALRLNKQNDLARNTGFGIRLIEPLRIC
ncbi:hypothetical protein LT249_07395 [Pseudomonas bijieensis]|nr:MULTISPECIES: hypothetical protein [Pseudomonas]MCD9114839.1 hypothetical protein [Pseudomonas bijieensis]